MKLVMDLRWVRSERIDGIGRFSLGLTKALIRLHPQIVVLYHKENLKPLLEDHLGRKTNFSRVPFDILTLSDFIKLPSFLNTLGTTHYFSPNFITSPFHQGYKVSLTVNDLIPFIYPESLADPSFKWRLFFATKLPTRWILGRTNLIAVISQSTKRDLEKMLGIPESKIFVVYPGFEQKEIVPPDPKYILYLGRMEPYKNLKGLIKAYAKLPKDLKERYELRLGGATKEPLYSSLRDLAQSEGVGDRVKFLGYVDEKDVDDVYSHAAVFVYPSLYEGFGLPVVEARLRGIPVVTSKLSSLPEAAGGGALTLDTTDTTELSAGMEKVLTDSVVRNNLLSHNKDLANQFSWDNSAKIVLDKLNNG